MVPPCKNQKPLFIVRGTTNSFGITLTDENGAEYTLESDQVLLFALKEEAEDTETVLEKEITHAANGEYYLELTPSDTASLKIHRYYYDVSLKQGSTILYNVIPASPFNIMANITSLG